LRKERSDLVNSKNELKKHILIVGASNLIAKLREIDSSIKTSVICRTSELQYLDNIKENQAVIIIQDHAPIEQWVEYAKKINEVDPFGSVISFVEIDQDKASAISEELNLNYHCSSTVSWILDKHLMRNRLKEIGVNTIQSKLIHSIEDIREFTNEFGFPVILKPSKGRSCTGIKVINNDTEIDEAYFLSETSYSPRYETSTLMLEPLLNGKEYSVETLTENGNHIILSILEKHIDHVSRVPIGHSLPAQITQEVENQIKSYLEEVLSALNIQFGMTHTELIITSEGPEIIEVHVCPAEDHIPELIHDSLGIDSLQYHVEQIVGLPIAERLKEDLIQAKSNQKGSAIWYSHINFEGTLTSIRNTEDVASSEGVQEFKLLINENTEVSRLMSSCSRIAYVRTLDENPIHALELAKAALKKLVMFFSVKG
jgi:formate-dependent phosphoribosylglycinamide formyltransferase (GAR transformylase)